MQIIDTHYNSKYEHCQELLWKHNHLYKYSQGWNTKNSVNLIGLGKDLGTRLALLSMTVATLESEVWKKNNIELTNLLICGYEAVSMCPLAHKPQGQWVQWK